MLEVERRTQCLGLAVIAKQNITRVHHDRQAELSDLGATTHGVSVC